MRPDAAFDAASRIAAYLGRDNNQEAEGARWWWKPCGDEVLFVFGRHEMISALDIRAELPKTAIGKLSKKEFCEEKARRRAASSAARFQPRRLRRRFHV